MFHPTTVNAATPRAVRTFISQVMDVNLADIHAMLRLPRPEVNITEGCNFSIVAVLMNVISGVSVVLSGIIASHGRTAPYQLQRRRRQARRLMRVQDAGSSNRVGATRV